MLISGNGKETYRLDLMRRVCQRDTDLDEYTCYYRTVAPVIMGETAYFVDVSKRIRAYRIAERKWEKIN